MNISIVLVGVAIAFALLAFVVVLFVFFILFNWKSKTQGSQQIVTMSAEDNWTLEQKRINDNQLFKEKYFTEDFDKEDELKFYGQLPQFRANVFSTEEIDCNTEQLDALLSHMEGMKETFFLVISDFNGNWLQAAYNYPDRKIDVEVTFRDKSYPFKGKLKFSDDIRYLIKDFFTGKEVINRYYLTND